MTKFFKTRVVLRTKSWLGQFTEVKVHSEIKHQFFIDENNIFANSHSFFFLNDLTFNNYQTNKVN